MALRLLETIKAQDAPPEVFEEEDPTVTMPRRLGLSSVVERQIRTYKGDVRRGARLSDDEIRDLFRLVIRRPDSEEIFTALGRALGSGAPPGAGARWLPRGLAMAVARRRTSRILKQLFGRRVGGFGRGPFSLEGRALLFIDADPGGEACALVTGLCEAVLQRSLGDPLSVRHTLCQAMGDSLCRWEAGKQRPEKQERREGGGASPGNPASPQG